MKSSFCDSGVAVLSYGLASVAIMSQSEESRAVNRHWQSVCVYCSSHGIFCRLRAGLK